MNDLLGLLALVLLALYGYAIVMILLATPPADPSDGVQLVASTIGTLVSGVVVAFVAAQAATGNSAGNMLPSLSRDFKSIIKWVYFVVWLVCGVTLLVAFMTLPKASMTLANAAKSFLGLVAATVAAYLGAKT